MFEWRFKWKERANYREPMRNTLPSWEKEQQGRGFSDGNKFAGGCSRKKASMMGVPAPQRGVWERKSEILAV